MLASDVLYEQPLIRRLQNLAGPGRAVYVSDPLRPGNARLEQSPLAVVEQARTFPDVDYPMCRASIFRLAGGSDGSAPILEQP